MPKTKSKEKDVATKPEVRKLLNKWKRQDRREDDKKYEPKHKSKCK
jgi:hypothetical protein